KYNCTFEEWVHRTYFILYFGLYLKTDEIILYLLRIVICFVFGKLHRWAF
ncbi:hypothetical protein M118_3668, partial [Bacteroides fragilis str. 3783N1-2]